MGLTTNLVRKRRNSYEVEHSGEEDCTEMYGHLTVFDQGWSPLNKEGNSAADNTFWLCSDRHTRMTMTVSCEHCEHRAE